MAMSMLNSGPKLDWTRDNQMFLRYKKWRSKVELIFRSALSKATPEEKTSYLKYWLGDEGLPLVEKWESTGKLDYSNAEEAPLSSGFQVQTYWDLLEEEFKPKGNKLISIIELWTRSKQGNKTLNEWLTYVYNLVEACNYGDSTDRIIRDVLIIGCESDRAKDNIIRRGETITINETIEILQTEASTNSTLRQFQEIQKKPTASIYYQSYDSRSKKSKAPSNEQNSSSSPTGSEKKCFRCGEPFSRQHMKECKAQDIICNGCGIKGHLKKCCKKSGNFPKDSSNRQNQSSPSTGSGKMNFASAAAIEADFFDEKGVAKQYIPQHPQYQHTGSMYVLKKFQGNPSDDILFSDNGVEIQHNTPTSVSDPDPAPILSPDFPFQEFPLTEVVNQSQIDYYSISDTSDPRESSNSSSKATKSTDIPLKSGLNSSTHEELGDIKGLAVSTAPTQSLRDSNTISTPDNSDTKKSNPGITTGITTDTPSTPTAFPEETDVAAIHAENPEELQMHLSNYRSVIPTDTQALTALQNLLSDDFDTHSTQRKGEETPDTRSELQNETFQLIQKIHNQLQEVQWDLQRLHSLHKYKN